MVASTRTPNADPQPARNSWRRWLLVRLLGLAAAIAAILVVNHLCWRARKAGETVGVQQSQLADGRPDDSIEAVLSSLPRTTETRDHLPGDAITNAFCATEKDINQAMRAGIGWSRPDHGFGAGLWEVYCVFAHRSFAEAPVSPLYYQGRLPDLVFERQIGGSPAMRDHIRLWKVAAHGPDGRPVWVGSATRDVGVGFDFCHFPLPTHRIERELQRESDFLTGSLDAAHRLTEPLRQVKVWKPWTATNGGGDEYVSNGTVALCVLAVAHDG